MANRTIYKGKKKWVEEDVKKPTSAPKKDKKD